MYFIWVNETNFNCLSRQLGHKILTSIVGNFLCKGVGGGGGGYKYGGSDFPHENEGVGKIGKGALKRESITYFHPY